jgi:hypothetical protein
MADENKKPNQIVEMIFRLCCVYVAATFFFYAWEKWQNQEYLLAASWFIFSLSQIGQIFGWFKNKSKFVIILMFIPIVFALIVILSNQWL